LEVRRPWRLSGFPRSSLLSMFSPFRPYVVRRSSPSVFFLMVGTPIGILTSSSFFLFFFCHTMNHSRYGFENPLLFCWRPPREVLPPFGAPFLVLSCKPGPNMVSFFCGRGSFPRSDRNEYAFPPPTCLYPPSFPFCLALSLTFVGFQISSGCRNEGSPSGFPLPSSKMGALGVTRFCVPPVDPPVGKIFPPRRPPPIPLSERVHQPLFFFFL